MADTAVAPSGQLLLLARADLDPIVAEAKRRLALDGIVVVFDRISIELVDLADGVLGEAIGNRILIDRDAAGYG